MDHAQAVLPLEAKQGRGFRNRKIFGVLWLLGPRGRHVLGHQLKSGTLCSSSVGRVCVFHALKTRSGHLRIDVLWSFWTLTTRRSRSCAAIVDCRAAHEGAVYGEARTLASHTPACFRSRSITCLRPDASFVGEEERGIVSLDTGNLHEWSPNGALPVGSCKSPYL